MPDPDLGRVGGPRRESTPSRAAPGVYAGTLDFTMGGDWFVLVTGDLPDGRQIEEKVDVPGVAAE